MASIIEQKNYSEDDDKRLFDTLAENLKLSFLTIARSAELANIKQGTVQMTAIETTASDALQLLDNYLLSQRLQRAGENLILEPISLAASMGDIAHQLEAAAHANKCDVELHIGGKYEPIMAHSAGLSAALLSLGNVFLQAQSQRVHTTRPAIKLAVHRTRYGLVAGLFADIEGLSADLLKRAQNLYGQSLSPLNNFTINSDAGVFVADALLKNMSTGLRAARYQKQPGLAATFAPSQQLVLV